ncbi:VanZ family protein [Paenibacillus sp. BSR1-1]|uniref:VanZ family protein n=1 Tax=Paenibacillus sp. BSR1-1 TaxID=3020845 RepID=UPI0025B1101E|nr:VanZ family protein [Paenibacillus sp. BSR1-1]MDN3019191.1 VanZ family protein [Paenibacillus sp. BSR1-1]
MKKKRWWTVAALVWMTLIFCFTQLPYFTGENTSKAINKVVVTEHNTINTPNADNKDINVLNILVRKSTHVTVFGILAILLFKSFEVHRYSYFLSLILTFLYAITDEYHQSFMPGRVSSFRDVLFDSFGAILALSLIFLIKVKRTKGLL